MKCLITKILVLITFIIKEIYRVICLLIDVLSLAFLNFKAIIKDYILRALDIKLFDYFNLTLLLIVCLAEKNFCCKVTHLNKY